MSNERQGLFGCVSFGGKLLSWQRRVFVVSECFQPENALCASSVCAYRRAGIVTLPATIFQSAKSCLPLAAIPPLGRLLGLEERRVRKPFQKKRLLLTSTSLSFAAITAIQELF